jgi:hypothetical protein
MQAHSFTHTSYAFSTFAALFGICRIYLTRHEGGVSTEKFGGALGLGKSGGNA